MSGYRGIMVNRIANYDEGKELFTELVDSSLGPKILFIHGISGAGKSTFIKYCLNQISSRPVTLDLELDPLPMSKLFIRFGQFYSWQKLPFFTQTVAYLLEQNDMFNNPIWQIKMHDHLKEIGKINDKASRLERFKTLADGLFYDTAAFEKPTTLIVENYEKGKGEFQEWFSESFLVKVAESENMRVLVSSQEAPDIQPAFDWRGHATIYEMRGVHDPKIWLDWAAQEGFQPPSLADMTEWVQIAEGNPKLMVGIINEECDRISGIAKLRYSTAELIQKMESLFKLQDVKNICMDLGINYENFRDHNMLGSLIREVVDFAKNNYRLPDLIIHCRRLRPTAF
jgi:hypothetical protein